MIATNRSARGGGSTATEKQDQEIWDLLQNIADVTGRTITLQPGGDWHPGPRVSYALTIDELTDPDDPAYRTQNAFLDFAQKVTGKFWLLRGIPDRPETDRLNYRNRRGVMPQPLNAHDRLAAMDYIVAFSARHATALGLTPEQLKNHLKSMELVE